MRRYELGDYVTVLDSPIKYRIIRRVWFFGWVYCIMRLNVFQELRREWHRWPELNKAYTDAEQKLIEELMS